MADRILIIGWNYLGTALIDLYRDKKLRQGFVKNAKLYLKKYNWIQEEQKYIDIIDYLVKPGLLPPEEKNI